MRPTSIVFCFLFTLCFATQNMFAMEKLNTKITTLCSTDIISKQVIEATLGLDLLLDKKASEQSGMQIYREGALAILSSFNKLELRVFNGYTRFFLLLYPTGNHTFNSAEITEALGKATFLPEDKKRHKPMGYKFEHNSKSICYYLNADRQTIAFVSIEGNYTHN